MLALAVLTLGTPAHAQSSRARARVAEAAGYRLLYALDVPVSADFNSTGVPYAFDDSASLSVPFDRIAYYLELEAPDGRIEWAYASMRAFSADPAQIGMPDAASGALHQRDVVELHVASNVGGIANGTFATGGNIELWSRNYAPGNARAVPNASDVVYDWGDLPVTSGDYGSFQIHHHAAMQTILAYNRWGAARGVPSDIGIGNAVDPASPGTGHVDWTFRRNAADWAARRLEVLVRPGPTPLELRAGAPLPHAVHQRDASCRASVPVVLEGAEAGQMLEARATPRNGQRGRAAAWRDIPMDPSCGCYRGALQLEAGWYDVDLRLRAGTQVLATYRVEAVGVGEVFVTAGQSNSANHGQPPLSPQDPRVSAFDFQAWRPAVDPQPIATGQGGSPWPVLGDLLAGSLDVPVGFVSVGWGGTRVGEWVPGGAYFPRLDQAIRALEPNGARAVLWHQGESDGLDGTSALAYADRLRQVIAGSRAAYGGGLPWGVALVSFLPNGDPARMAAIIDGQTQVIAGDPLVFEGPATDAWVGPAYRSDTVHFNEAGLRAHAAGWATSLAAAFPDLDPTCGQAAIPPPVGGVGVGAVRVDAPPARAVARAGAPWLAISIGRLALSPWARVRAFFR
jgi:hypothetical protein